ncbi:LOW QUALITY PROTEIN: hypothetical protein ACHAW6_002500, partial [Cyclotella cf. meneghiniana]
MKISIIRFTSVTKFEEICHDLLERTVAPIAVALKMANVTLQELHAVEMIGDNERSQEGRGTACLGGMELGMHLISDESMALGAAFHGANVSTLFKVRHVGMSVVFRVDLVDLEKKGDTIMERRRRRGCSGLGRKRKEKRIITEVSMLLFLKWGLGAKKMIAFLMDRDVHVQVNNEESNPLPQGTRLCIEQYVFEEVVGFVKEMKDKRLEGLPKMFLQFEMSTSRLTQLIKADAVMEETVMVEEEVEVEDKEGDNVTLDVSDAKCADAEKSKKESKKDDKSSKEDEAKTKDAKVSTYNVGWVRPYTPTIMAESKAKLQMLAQNDKDCMMLNEAKNTYEADIYFTCNKMSDYKKAIAIVTSKEHHEPLLKSAEDAKEW